MRSVLPLLLLVACAPCTPEPASQAPMAPRTRAPRTQRAAPPAPDPTPSCLTWGPAVPISPPGGLHHHPTAVWVDGALLVAWQSGKRPSPGAPVEIHTARSDQDGRSGPVHVVSAGDPRPTHPQLATDGTAAWIAWTDDATADLRLRALDARGVPTAPPERLIADERPWRYPDLAVDEGGPVTLAFRGNQPSPAVGRWRPGEAPVLQHVGDATHSGPPALGPGSQGPWLAFTASRGGARRTTALRWGPLGAAPAGALEVYHRAERPALDARGPLALAWTRYPDEAHGWGVFRHTTAAGGDSTSTEVDDRGRMVDLARLADGAELLAWERPLGAGNGGDADGDGDGDGGWQIATLVVRHDAPAPCGPEPLTAGPSDTRAAVVAVPGGAVVLFQRRGPDGTRVMARWTR
jgi:hypothetical protein